MSGLVLVSQTSMSIFTLLSILLEYNMTMTDGVPHRCLQKFFSKMMLGITKAASAATDITWLIMSKRCGYSCS